MINLIIKRFHILIFLIFAALFMAACQSAVASQVAEPLAPPLDDPQAPETTEAVLNDIDSIDELRELFIRDAGKTRLVLLLSPT